jgi:hypothetical protein
MIERDGLPDGEAFAGRSASQIPARPSLTDEDEVGGHVMGQRRSWGRATARKVAVRAPFGSVVSRRTRPPTYRAQAVDMSPFHAEGTVGGGGR